MKIFIICSLLLLSTQIWAQKGKASYYANKFEGHKTASGQIYHANKLTAAHRKFPFGTRVKVTNLKNNKSVIVVINDRGPYSKRRLIDLSKAAAINIDMIRDGIVKVRIKRLKGNK